MSSDEKNLTGRALNLTELIQYQPGTVVSRTLLNKKTGTLTLFAFDEGEGLSEHTVPFEATVQILDGSADVTIDGVDQRVTAGEMLIMPAHHPHSLRAAEKFKMLLIMIRD